MRFSMRWLRGRKRRAVGTSVEGLRARAGVRGAVPGWPAEAVFWREFANAFLHALAQVPEADGGAALSAAVPEGLFFSLTLRIPAMRGAEYAGPEVFAAL